MLLPLHLNLENGFVSGRTFRARVLSSRLVELRGGGRMGDSRDPIPTLFGKSNGVRIMARGGSVKSE